MVCQYMGHEKSIHDSYYRLPTEVENITQMSVLLKSVANGKVNKLRSIDVLKNQQGSSSNDSDTCTREDESSLTTSSILDIPLQTRKQKPTISNAREGKLFDSGDNSDSDPYDSDADPVFVEPLESSEEESSDESAKLLETPPKRRQRICAPKLTWRTPGRSAMKKECLEYLSMPSGKLPSLAFLKKLQNKYPILKRRTVFQMKTWISNQRKKKNT